MSYAACCCVLMCGEDAVEENDFDAGAYDEPLGLVENEGRHRTFGKNVNFIKIKL